MKPRLRLGAGLRFLWRKRRTIWSLFEAGVALLCLLVTHQAVWVYFQELSGRLRAQFPNPAVWLLPQEETTPVSPAAEQAGFQVDQPRIHLRGFAPPNRPVYVRVNGVQAGMDMSYDGRLNFYNIPLRRGSNVVEAYLGEGGEPGASSRWDLPAPQRITYLPPKPLPSKFLGAYLGEHQDLIVLGLADPSASVWLHRSGAPDSTVLWLDQLGIFRYFMSGLPDSGTTLIAGTARPGRPDLFLASDTLRFDTDLPPLRLARRVRMQVTPEGIYKINLAANLPSETALQEWLEEGLISPPELLVQFFGLQLSSLLPISSAPAKWWYNAPVLAGNRFSLYLEGQVPAQGLSVSFIRASLLNDFPLVAAADSLQLEVSKGVRLDLKSAPDVVWQESDSLQICLWQGGARQRRPQDELFHVGGGAETPAVAPEISPGRAGRGDLVAQLRHLQSLVPDKLGRIFHALLTAIPFFWLLWILRRPGEKEQTGYRNMLAATTITFLVFHLTLLSLPVFSFSFSFLGPLLSLFAVSHEVLSTVAEVAQIYPFLAIGIMVLFRPLYHAYRRRRTVPTRSRRVLRLLQRWLVFWPLALALPAALFHGLVVVRSEAPAYSGTTLLSREFLVGAAAFALLGLACFWFFLHWFIRIGLGRDLRPRTSLMVSWAMLLLPLLPILVEALARLLRYLIVTRLELYPFFIPPRLDNVLWILIISGVGAAMFYQITDLSLRLSRHQPSLRFWHTRWAWLLVPLFFILSLPLGYLLGTASRPEVSIWDLQSLAYGIDNLLPYALLLALLAFLRRLNPQGDLRLRPEALQVGTILFAYYLTGRTANLLFIPIPLLLGWYIFKRWVLAEAAPATAQTSGAPLRELVGRLLHYRQSRRLAQTLRANLEKKYAQGELALAELQKRVSESESEVEKSRAALPAGEAQAKLDIFGRGPEASPWANARVAVVYGLFLSIPFQISTLVNILRQQRFENYPVLQFLAALLFAASTWLLIAFVFGYFFHVIRGRDGFVKAMVFSLALLIPTIPLRLIGSQPLLEQGHVVQIVQILAYVLLLALIAFDLRSLQKLGYGWRELLAVHGFTTITAYGSSILLATLASLSGKDLVPLAWKAINWLIGLNSAP